MERRFKKGDRVRTRTLQELTEMGSEYVSAEIKRHLNTEGVVVDVNPGPTDRFPYLVEFENGGQLFFAENELVDAMTPTYGGRRRNRVNESHGEYKGRIFQEIGHDEIEKIKRDFGRTHHKEPQVEDLHTLKFKIGDTVRNMCVVWSSGGGGVRIDPPFGTRGIVRRIERKHLDHLLDWWHVYMIEWDTNPGYVEGKPGRALALDMPSVEKMYGKRRRNRVNENSNYISLGDRVRVKYTDITGILFAKDGWYRIAVDSETKGSITGSIELLSDYVESVRDAYIKYTGQTPRHDTIFYKARIGLVELEPFNINSTAMYGKRRKDRLTERAKIVKFNEEMTLGGKFSIGDYVTYNGKKSQYGLDMPEELVGKMGEVIAYTFDSGYLVDFGKQYLQDHDLEFMWNKLKATQQREVEWGRYYKPFNKFNKRTCVTLFGRQLDKVGVPTEMYGRRRRNRLNEHLGHDYKFKDTDTSSPMFEIDEEVTVDKNARDYCIRSEMGWDRGMTRSIGRVQRISRIESWFVSTSDNRTYDINGYRLQDGYIYPAEAFEEFHDQLRGKTPGEYYGRRRHNKK